MLPVIAYDAKAMAYDDFASCVRCCGIIFQHFLLAMRHGDVNFVAYFEML